MPSKKKGMWGMVENQKTSDAKNVKEYGTWQRKCRELKLTGKR